MNGEVFGNATVTGLVGGAAIVLIFQVLWGRIFGSPSEQSLPVQLAAIQAQLTAINLKLELFLQEKEHMKGAHQELKNDFYNHMEKHHIGVVAQVDLHSLRTHEFKDLG